MSEATNITERVKLETKILVGEPVAIDGEGIGGGGGGEEGTGEAGAAVTLEGYVIDGVGGDDLVVGVEGIDGDGDGLFVSGEEEIGDGVDRTTARDGDGVDQTGIGRGDACGGVEGIATGRDGGADLGDSGRTVIRGDDGQTSDKAVEGSRELEGIGIGHRDGLSRGEGVTNTDAIIDGRSGTGEGEWRGATITEDEHGV